MDWIADQIEREIPKALADLRRLVQVPSVAAQRQGIPEAVQVVSDLFRDAAAG